MNGTWLYSSAPGLQPLHSATHQVTIQLRELRTLQISTLAFSLAP